jgi:hypothetical protein
MSVNYQHCDSGWEGHRSVCLGCPELVAIQHNDRARPAGEQRWSWGDVEFRCGHTDAEDDDGSGRIVPDWPFTPGWCPSNWWLDALAGKIQKQETLF